LIHLLTQVVLTSFVAKHNTKIEQEAYMQKWEYKVLTLIGTRYTREQTGILEIDGKPAYYNWF
jgi:hypothetical protein